MTRESYFSSSMRRVVKRTTGDLHFSSRRGTSAGLQLKMLQQQGLLPLLENEAEAPVVPNGYGLATGAAFSPCFLGGKEGGEERARRRTLMLALNPRAGERNHMPHLAQGCHFNNATLPPLKEGTVKNKSEAPYTLREKKAGYLAHFKVSVYATPHGYDNTV